MNFLNQNIAPIGMGCWPIGGEMFSSDGQALGYGNADDRESLKTIEAALAHGIELFDTAAAYGVGHSERLLAKALKHHPNTLVVTKIGIAINEQTKTLLGSEVTADSVIPAIERCLLRLNREVIDLVLLHQNDLPINEANGVFEQMMVAKQRGWIREFGWSTDFIDRVGSQCHREGFVAVEHAMHVLMDAPNMQRLLQRAQLTALIRSPLAMGLLSGKYDNDSTLPHGDVRATNQGWLNAFIDGKPNPEYLERLHVIRELLQTDGRTIVQGALAWLWAKSSTNIPIPGARTVRQIEEISKAVELGPLPKSVMSDIASIVGDFNVSKGDSER